MNNLKKNFWLKITLGTLLLVVFLLPVSFDFKNNATTIIENKASAAIDKMVILPVDPTTIKENGVTVQIEITGQPDANEKINLTLKTLWTVVNTWPIPDTMIDKTVASQVITLPLQYNLDKNTTYQIVVFKPDNSVISNTVEFKGDGTAIDNNGGPAGTTSTGQNPIPPKPDLDIGCGYNPITWFTKCPVLFLYEFIFEPIAGLTTLAAKFLDFFVYYSISSDAYRSGFVEKAWSVVRDISNMLFIIALLYIAVKTILQMNTSNQQRALGYIIMIALVINFSLFISRVVIDASNILARVFYNNITPYDENGNAIPPESNKPKSVSVGLVRAFEPQRVVSDPKNNTGQFALVTIIFIVLMVYMILMFVSTALLFLGRVAGLWMAMMFSPIAFASVAMPFPIPKFSFGEWRKELFRLAFMAPIFAFFLYIIILFGGFLSEIQYHSTSISGGPNEWLDALMKNIIPFILIFVLLKEAKAITKEYAGKMGEAFNSAGAMVGGLALGAATGGLAMAGRAGLGRLGSVIARNEGLKAAEAKGTFGAATLRNIGKYASTGNFDLRSAKIAGKGLSDTGLKKLGTAQKGGFEKIRSEKLAKRQKRAAELQVDENSNIKQKLNSAELELQMILEQHKPKLESLDKQIEEARKNLRDATSANDQSGVNMYSRQIKVFKAQKTAIRNGQKDFDMSYNQLDADGNMETKNIKEDYSDLKTKDGHTVSDLEGTIIKDLKNEIDAINRERRRSYGKHIGSATNKTLNFLRSFGQHSGKGANEAKHRIIMSAKLDSGEK